MKSIIELENEAANIKSKCVRIAGEFRVNKPNHEFTSWFNEIESHIYSQHELLIKTIRENERLKFQMSEIQSSELIEFEESIEYTSQMKFEPIDDVDYLRKPMQSKAFDEPNF